MPAEKIVLISSAGTGYQYFTTISGMRGKPESGKPVNLMKYDPVVRKKVLFKGSKKVKGSKKD